MVQTSLNPQLLGTISTRFRLLVGSRSARGVVSHRKSRQLEPDKAHLSSKRICLFGLFGGGNYGNDGSLESMILFLRQLRPEADLSCVCVDPDYIGRIHQIETFGVSFPGFSSGLLAFCNRLSFRAFGKVANWFRAIWYLRRFGLLIVPGTSTLCDYRSGPFGTPYGLFRWAAAARLCGLKFCFIGTGAGPIDRPLSRWMLRRAAKWAYYRSFRDQVSKDFITSLGIDTSADPVHPDLVFRLPTPSPSKHDRVSGPITIGVGVMDYTGWQSTHDPVIYNTYLAKMGSFVIWLLERGHRVRLLIGENHDECLVKDLAVMLVTKGYRVANQAPPTAEAGQVIAEPIQSLHDLMRQIADTEIVVATRFHNVVCSLKLAKPTVSIGYEAKNDAVMAAFGLGHFCQHIEQLDVERLQTQTEELLNRYPYYHEQIRARLMETQQRLAEHEKILAATLL